MAQEAASQAAHPLAGVRACAGRAVAPGGYLHAATDWEDYANEMLATLAAEALLRNTAEGFALRPAARPLTKFEARGRRLGHEVFDLVSDRPATDPAPGP